MKNNRVKIYAKVLAELMVDKKNLDEKKIVENFLRLLEKNRDTGKIKEILEAAENIFIKKTGRRKILVETARALKPKQKELVESIMQKGDIVSQKINKDLVGGIRITINDAQLDLSMITKINSIL